jgi:hypothetical protein
MGNTQKLLDFIRKGPMRSPSVGPPSHDPSKKSPPPEDPLAAFKISQQAKREAEVEGRKKTMVEQVREKIAPQPKSDEVPM